MDKDVQKISHVLADPTRYSIYEYIHKHIEPVSVQESSDLFEIHTNVARLHLSKLEDAGLIYSYLEKSRKGGRPGRLYVLSHHEKVFSFPPRDYKLLAHIAIESLLELGEEGIRVLNRIGEKFGKQIAEERMKHDQIDSKQTSFDQALSSIHDLIHDQGLRPEFEVIDSSTLRFRVNNCTFQNVAEKHSTDVCHLHYSLLLGIFQTYFGKINLYEDSTIFKNKGCQSCDYKVIKIPVKKV